MSTVLDPEDGKLDIEATVADSKETSNPEICVEKAMELEKALNVIMNLPKQKAIVFLEYLNGKMSMRGLGRKYGISQSWVSRIVQDARRRVREEQVSGSEYDVTIRYGMINVRRIRDGVATKVPSEGRIFEGLRNILEVGELSGE